MFQPELLVNLVLFVFVIDRLYFHRREDGHGYSGLVKCKREAHCL